MQYLRAIAAIGVVVFHASLRLGEPIYAGATGVDLFFVLSGFLMVAITDEETRSQAFFADRLRRIAPVYWIATTAVLATALLGLFSPKPLDAWHVIASYLFVPATNSEGNPWPLLIPGWTLNYEMFFYLAFALLMALKSQVRQVAVLTVLFAAMVIAGAALQPSNVIAKFYSYSMILEFVFGCWIGIAWKRIGDWPRAAGPVLLGLGAVLLTAASLRNTFDGRFILFGGPAALILLGVLAIERHRPIAKWRLPLLLGDASYSIYLWHLMAIDLAAKVCSVLKLPAFAIVPVGVAAGVVGGTIAYLVIERPILHYFRARRSIRGVPIPAGP